MRATAGWTTVAALIAGALLAGCAGDAGDEAPTPSPSNPATASPTAAVPPTVPPVSPSVPPGSPPSTPPPGEVRISGELVEGVEAGCLLLRTDAGDYLLFGEPVEDLGSGGTATLRGRVRPDMASTCQQGTPFEVTEVLG